MLDISLLGSPAIGLDGERISRVERHSKKLGVLAYLCSQAPGRTTSRDTLLALFWPESSSSLARHGLSQMLHFLRKELGDVVALTGAQRLALNESMCTVDVWRFERAIAERRWEEASALYQGELLEGVFINESQPAQDWLENARASYRGRAIAAMWRAAGEAAEHGRAAAAAEQATRALRLDPLQERQCAALVDALVQQSEHGSALAVISELQRGFEQATGEGLSAEWLDTRARIADARMKESVPVHVVAREVVIPPRAPVGTSKVERWPRAARAVVMTMVAFAGLALGKLVVTQAAEADGGTPAVLAVAPLTTQGDSGVAAATLNALVHALRDSAGVTVLLPTRDQATSGAVYSLEAGLIRNSGGYALSYQLRHLESGLVLGSGRTGDAQDPNDSATELAFRVSGDLDQFDRLAPLRSADAEAVARWNSAVALHVIADSLRSAGAFREAIEQYKIADSVYAAAGESRLLHLIASLARVQLASPQAVAAVLSGRVADAKHLFAEAVQRMERIEDAYPQGPEVFRARGILQYHRWIWVATSRDDARLMLDSSERDLRTALRLDPVEATTLNALSGVLFAKGQYPASLVYARQAWEKRSYRIDPRELLNRLFLASFNAYDDRSAIKWCGELRDRYPGEWPGATCTLMIMAWSSGVAPDTDLAWQIVKTGLSREPPHVRNAFEPRLTLLQAAILARAGKPYAGLATVESVDDTRDIQLLGFKAAALLALADTARARTVAREYSNSHPLSADLMASDRIYKGLDRW